MKVNKLVEVRLNTHQQHLESLPVFGESGLDELNNYIEKLLKQLTTGTKELTLMSKIDGAPSVIMWHKIGNGYPDNSIALKSFVNGPSTAMSSAEEIDKKYSDRPDMAEKLKQCLKLAKYIPTGEAWQGDCLFTKNDLKEETINNVTYVTFHPNKIVYAFSEDNPGYNSIKNADFGIAFHTIYTINNGVISQSFEVDNSRINAPDNFYLLFHEMGTQNKENDFNIDKLVKDFSELKQIENKLINDTNYEELVNNKQFISYWNTFENREFADNKKTNINPNTILKDLKEYILNKKEQEFNKKQSTLKTDQGKAKAKEKYDSELLELEDLLNNNKDTIINMVNAINKAADVKMDLWRSLNKTKDEYSSFYKSKSKGFIPANREGISMSDADGNLVKIVDRSEFSSNNRNPDYMAGFEHESFSVATQGANMGSFKSFTKNINEDTEKVAVVAIGRMNPPTIGHKALVNALAKIGSKYGVKPKLFLTHSTNNIKNPLSYESKLRWAAKAFGDDVEIVRSNARSIIEFLSELYNEGYTKIVYAGDDKRIGGNEDVTKLIDYYNKNTDKKGNILYRFNEIEYEPTGEREKPTNGGEESSGTIVRKLAAEKNFDEFKKYVPFNESDAKNLFNELRFALKDFTNIVEKYLKEYSVLKKNKYTPEVQDELDKELDKIDKDLDAPDPDMGVAEYRQHKDEYSGLFVKQGKNDGDVSFNSEDIKTLYDDKADKIIKGLDNLTVTGEDGKEYELHKSDSKSVRVFTASGGGLEPGQTTLLQEAISGLILGDRIKEQDIGALLEKSDPVKRTGIFKYLNINFNITPEDWADFIKKWRKTFNLEQANKGEFIAKINSLLKGGVQKANIIHDGLKNEYSQIAKSLLAGADEFDKSDVYYCTGNTGKILKQLYEFRQKNDIRGYVKFMEDNTDKIVGVSLKQLGGSMHVAWDIPPKTTKDFDDRVFWPKSDASSQELRFYEGDDTEYILSIRSNSSKKGSSGTIEWREKGAPSMMGKGASKLGAIFGEEFAKEFTELRKDRNFVGAVRLFLDEIAGTGTKPGNTYKMTPDGKKKLIKFFNDACGFNSRNEAGERISAPYIKVY